jgi:hypothetical protein
LFRTASYAQFEPHDRLPDSLEDFFKHEKEITAMMAKRYVSL